MYRSIASLSIVLCVVFLAGVGHAESAEPKRFITIDSGVPELKGDSIILNASASFNLPDILVTALHKGVHLVFVTELQVLQKRQVWLDDKIVKLKLPRQLQFHALTRKYIVQDSVSSKRASFNSLPSALKYLGKYQEIAIMKTSFAKASHATDLRMRISLQRNYLPLPLRLQSYFSLFWSVSSGWKKWSL